VDAIADKLEQAYRMWGNDDYRKRARDGALAYDAEKVAEKYWKPVLADIEESVAAWQVTNHVHTWCKVGLFNQDGSMSVPCSECGAELVVIHGKQEKVIEGGFTNPAGLKFTRPDGLEWLLLRETYRDYKAEELNLTKDSVVVDIGAHVGVVSMTLAQQFGCQVYAYEPNPDNFERLTENVKANGLTDLVRVYNLAVTKDGREVNIGTDTDNSGSNSIYKGGVPVESVTLDDIFNVVGERIDLLKIDCEGAECEILEGDHLDRIGAIRGEFHGPDAPTLLELVKEQVPDTKVTLQGVKG
jgi:FkbM family methyltransferase